MRSKKRRQSSRLGRSKLSGSDATQCSLPCASWREPAAPPESKLAPGLSVRASLLCQDCRIAFSSRNSQAGVPASTCLDHSSPLSTTSCQSQSRSRSTHRKVARLSVPRSKMWFSSNRRCSPTSLQPGARKGHYRCTCLAQARAAAQESRRRKLEEAGRPPKEGEGRLAGESEQAAFQHASTLEPAGAGLAQQHGAG